MYEFAVPWGNYNETEGVLAISLGGRRARVQGAHPEAEYHAELQEVIRVCGGRQRSHPCLTGAIA